MVQGLDRLQARWQAIPQKAVANVTAAMEKVAGEIVADMERLAPKGKSRELLGSIGWTWGDAPKGTMTIGSVGGQEYGALRITFYAGGGKAFYARFQEHGTVKMPANPFFYPVWRIWKKRVRARMSAAFRKALR